MNDIAGNDVPKDNSSKRSWNKLLVAVIIAVIGFSAYGGYKAYKRYKFNKQWQLQNQIAEENALEYVRDKYAIDDAEVVSFSNDDDLDDLRRFKDGEESWINRDHNVVTLDSDGHEFRVVVKWRERSSEGYDSYYTDEVEELLKQQIVESCHGEPVYTNIALGTFNMGSVWSYRGIYMAKDEHFDGDLKGVLKDKIISVDAVVINTVFDDHEVFDMLAEVDADADFYSFDTMEHFEAAKHNNLKINGNELEMMHYAPYITDYRTIHDGKNVHRDFGVKTKDDMLFRAFPDNLSDSDVHACDDIIITDSDDIDQYYSYNNLDEYLRSPISSGYAIGDYRSGDLVCIYYPLEKLKGHDTEDVGLAWAKSAEWYDIIRPAIVGDYAVFIITPDISFKIVDTKGLEPIEPGVPTVTPN